MLEPDPEQQLQTDLLHRIAAQDREALAAFYDQVGALIYSTALHVVGDGQEAEEIVQDVFVQIWNKAATFDAALGRPVSWALRITRNRAIDQLRSQQRRFRMMAEIGEQSHCEPTANQPSPAASPLHADELAAIRSAVRSLPTEQREAIEMAFFGGLTHIEIAESLQQPLGTIKARIRRGMMRLRDALQEYA